MDPAFLRACVEERAKINLLNGMSITQQKLLEILEDFLWSKKKLIEVLEKSNSCQQLLNIGEEMFIMLICEHFEENAVQHFTSIEGDWNNLVTVDNVLKGCRHYLFVAHTMRKIVRDFLNWSEPPRTAIREFTSEELNKAKILGNCKNALSVVERETAMLETEISSIGQ